MTVGGRGCSTRRAQTAGGQVVLVRSAGLAFAAWRPFLGSLIVAGVGGALLALALSYALARRLTRPIGSMSAADPAAGRGRVRRAACRSRGDDELAGLGRAFNEMSGRARLAPASRSGSFLESVSHELKTPLTSIRGYAEAIDEGAVAPADGARVIARRGRPPGAARARSA